MKHTRIRIVVLLLTLVATACGGSDDESSGSAGDSPSASEVSEACLIYCDSLAAVGCPFLKLMGGIAACKADYCDMTGVSADCLKAKKAHFDCANQAEDACYDCSTELRAVTDC